MKSPIGENSIVSDDIRVISTPKRRKAKDSNNHHVVPLGILVVLCTVYIMAAGLQRNYRYYFRSGVAAFDLPQTESEEPQLEAIDMDDEHHEEACQRIDIFGGDADGNKSENQISKRPQAKISKRTRTGPGSKHPRAPKSLEISRKKEVAKKSNTAEPIIYLFALVFIYLLLKAASDINQHYKSQNKGDKRLRRCSLQSYAQIHKQDRRASKGISPKTLPKF
ncbi:uncharacterized protein Dana_GF27615, isoform B [Drosophila ananassae]|uniref:Uncharacterized protein, isoform B n=1 Tax=Drosophila ananassae TaxID=7217 RepID=A0A0N8P065_DROAN|nr:uncharacterized protein Dana_GF27615, isoform B [Drosophila ananassae]